MRSPSPARAGLVIMTGTGRGVAVVRAGFSLLETMLALVVVIMLATLVVPALTGLGSDARADRARAEIASAMSDARSLARARGMPVVVSVIAGAGSEEESEIVGVVVAAGGLDRELDAMTAGDAEETGGEAAALDAAEPTAGEGTEDEAAEAAGNAAVGSAKRRLGVLPAGCAVRFAAQEAAAGVGAAMTAESETGLDAGADGAVKGATGAAAAGDAMMMIAVVFPDGTAAVPGRKLELVVAGRGRGRGAARVFAIRMSPWFAEAAFAERTPAAAEGEEKETGASETVDAAEDEDGAAETVMEKP
jgi:type II secretory pathway pseudopilin PulG